VSLAGLIEGYLAARESEGLASLTLRNQRSHLQRFAGFLRGEGVEAACDVTRESIEAYMQALSWEPTCHGNAMKVESRNVRLSSIKGFCRWMVQSDRLSVDPSEAVAYAREPDPLPKNILSAAQMKQLLAAPDTQTVLGFRDRVVLELLYSTGVRVSELCGLDVDDIDLDLEYARVQRGKGGRGRVVPVGVLACALVKSYVAEVRPRLRGGRDDDSALLLSRYGRRLRPRGVAKLINKHAQRSGLKEHVTPHTFRHSCATHMLRGGAGLRHLQEMLGHRKVTSTEVYTRVTIDELKGVHARYHPRGEVDEVAARKPKGGRGKERQEAKS